MLFPHESERMARFRHARELIDAAKARGEKILGFANWHRLSPGAQREFTKLRRELQEAVADLDVVLSGEPRP